jgi:hypothetical protein
MMHWNLSHRASPRGVAIADRHYNRQKIGTPQFVPPGRCVVLVAESPHVALWVSSWPFAEYVKHEWPGAWVCSCFRNESTLIASELITEAVAATRSIWDEPPQIPSAVGLVSMVSFIDRSCVRPTTVRGRHVYGWTWLKAGWEVVGETKGGLLALGLRTERLPTPQCPANVTPGFW